MFIDPTTWMPKELPDDIKKAFADQYREDPHRAAAEAWEFYAGQMDPEPGIIRASTGAQNVAYKEALGKFHQAEGRARWHRARMRGRSVAVVKASDSYVDEGPF